jgi:hypothetical protein
MSRDIFFSPDLFLSVKAGFLELSSKDEVIATLSAREVSEVVSKLCRSIEDANFKLNLSDTMYLFKDKLVWGQAESQLSRKQFSCFIRALLDCIPHMLVRGTESFSFVACVKALVVHLGALNIQEGLACVEQLAAGMDECVIIKEFLQKKLKYAGNSERLQRYFFFNVNTISTCLKLRHLLKASSKEDNLRAISKNSKIVFQFSLSGKVCFAVRCVAFNPCHRCCCCCCCYVCCTERDVILVAPAKKKLCLGTNFQFLSVTSLPATILVIIGAFIVIAANSKPVAAAGAANTPSKTSS